MHKFEAVNELTDLSGVAPQDLYVSSDLTLAVRWTQQIINSSSPTTGAVI